MKKILATAITITTLLASNSVLAGDSSFRQANEKASRQGSITANGGNVSSIVLMELASSSQSNEEIANSIALLVKAEPRDGGASTALAQGGIDRIIRQDNRYNIGNKEWGISVRNNGTEASFRNYAYVEKNPHTKALGKIPEKNLEVKARGFVMSSLVPFLPMGEGEGIELWSTQFEHELAGSDTGEVDEDVIVSSRAIFVRTIDGVPVIGAGSKVEVTFANDGAVVGFSFDWPRIERSNEKQEIVLPSQVLSRTASLIPETPSDIDVIRHECGYFDPGGRYRDSAAQLQAACFTRVIRTRHQNIDGEEEVIRSGISVATPIGEDVKYDEEIENSHPSLYGISQAIETSKKFGAPNKEVLVALGRRAPL